jgi:predicted extracellular nuclease
MEFKIGSFNLYNLVLPEKKYYGRRSYSRKDYNKKTSWIAQQLDRMEADIVGFQEIFHEEALKDAVAKNNRYREATVLTSHAQGDRPVVGLISNFPVISHEVVKEFKEPLDMDGVKVPVDSFSRPILRALIQIPGSVQVSVYVAHLKSKRPSIPEGVDPHHPLEKAKGQARSLIRRAAEATALRDLLLEELKDRDHPVILLGDVNDNGLAVTTRIVSGDPPFRNMPHHVKKEIWDVLLYHVKDIQARQSYQDYYYSHIHNGHYEALDHIMVSQELVAHNPNHLGRVGFVSVLNDHLIDETLSDDRVELWQSDHAQVVASIEMRD